MDVKSVLRCNEAQGCEPSKEKFHSVCNLLPPHNAALHLSTAHQTLSYLSVQEAREERARLVAENQQLQRRCAAIMGTKRSADRSNEGGLLDDEMRYSSVRQGSFDSCVLA